MSESHYQREVEWYETLLTQKSKKIVELEAENERLRAALRGLIGAVADHTSQKPIPQALTEARTALEGRA